MTRRSGACLGMLLLILATIGASADSPKRVLILDPFGRDVAPYSTVVSAFRSTLSRELGAPVDIYELPLDLARFGQSEGEGPLVAFIEGRIKSQPVDLLVPVGSAAVQFVARHRQRLFPETPILVLATPVRVVPPDFLETNATLITQNVNLPGMVEDILQLQPQTTNIVVVFGASALEKFWANECRREFRSFTNRVGFTWLNELSLEQMLERCGALPPRSFILHGLFVVDATGIPCEKNEALRRLHETANAPLFGYYASQLGLGPIGGRLYQDSESGVQGARIAIRILSGEKPGNIPPKVLEEPVPIYDWRELHRWGISESRLPPGSIVEFRQRTFWQQYRWHIVGVVAFCGLQTALIIGLLVNRAKRRQGEAEAALIAEISSKFVNLPPADVDREIMDAERRICEFLEIDFSALWQWADEPPGRFLLTHYYSVQEGPQPSKRLNDQDYPWFVQQFLAGRTVAISSLEELPAEAAPDREVCRRHGVKSNLSLPLSVGGKPVGILGLNTTRAERDWPEALVHRLQLVAQIFANALARKRADHALRASEELNRATFEQAAVGIAHVATDGRWLRVNDKLCSIVGYPRDELLKLTYQDITHPEDLEQDRNLLRQFLSGELKTGWLENRYLRKDQSTIWVVISVSLARTAAGDPLHFIAVVEDITERKQAEERVRELSLAVQQSPVSVVITDLEGKITYVNRKFSEVSGYSLAECIGQNPRILKSGETPPATYQELWACITRGDIWRGEFHNRKKNGELYWEWAVISPLLDATGKVTHFVGVKENITERKLTEEALRASGALLETSADLAGLGCYEVDYGECRCFIDQRFHQICGVPAGRQTGLLPVQLFTERLHPDDRQRVLDLRAKLHDGRLDRLTLEYRYLHPTEGEKWLEHIARISERNAAGQALRSHGAVRDITAQKRAELESQELRNNLTHLTRVNTLGALSGSLAHELNQPLGIILSNAQAAQELLAQEPPDVSEVQAILTDVVKADRRAGEVIERLRALLKRGQISLQPLSLNFVVEEVLHLTRADLIGRGVTVSIDLAPDLPLIAGDRVQLQQLLLNLILNAADAMSTNPPGARGLQLRTMRQENQVRTSVQDEGGGLPADVEQLFKPFYTTKPHGLGMGLAICRSIVAAHHGRLWAEPNCERGAVFHFEIPLAEDSTSS